MALPVRQQLQIWGIVALLFFVSLWFLGGVLLPFLIAAALAYVLDPMADRLEAMGFSRALATVMISLLALVMFAVLAVLVIPALISQGADLAQSLPRMVNRLINYLTEEYPTLLDSDSRIRQSLDSIGAEIRSHGARVFQGILASAMSVVNVVLLFVLVPVITFYLLLDWDRMIARVDELLPRDHAPTIRNIAGEISDTLASFIRGQGLVCLILGSYYAIGLTLCGLNYGPLVGAIAGMITFIPYVGAIIGGALAIGLALFQFWGEWWWILAVAGVFALGQFLEGNIITPKLVGDSVGLHPVWLIFALSAFGAVFGFAGLLIAVPMTAALGVLIRHGVRQYKSSLLFKGQEGHMSTPETKPAARKPAARRTRAKKSDA